MPRLASRHIIRSVMSVALSVGITNTAIAQAVQPDDVDWGLVGASFVSGLQSWQPGEQLTQDDNFFISRVRPHQRFTNTATQVNPDIMDRNLCYWVPCGTLSTTADSHGQELPQMILPSGQFDADVFTMWPYITHWGVWTAPLLRMPANLADVAHRNGVPVSCTADIPTGALNSSWTSALTRLTDTDTTLIADYMSWYGIDGFGYNSEFSTSVDMVTRLQNMHEALYRQMRTSGRDPIFDIIWYDGMTTEGRIMYDCGLWKYNHTFFGDSAHMRSIFFFNYNWNEDDLLIQSQKKAAEIGRSTRDIYCGFNMQGQEPKLILKSSQRWPMLQRYPFSIGLWGAHSESMLWESRDEQGASPSRKQRSYLLRQERWFGGGSRNPISTGDVTNSMRYDVCNYNFFGMSKLLSARSALCWDISEEPFITHFNVGNGTFFNREGRRQHDVAWSNIGVQDHLPTWRYWLATQWLGRDAADADTGLDAELTWSDAYLGGSCLRILHGRVEDNDGQLSASTAEAPSAWLHLFKTDFSVTADDTLSLRIKRRSGSGRISLVTSLTGDEATPVTLGTLDLDTCSYTDWTLLRVAIGDLQTDGGETRLAVIGLRLEQYSSDMDFLVGELSLCPATSFPTPAAPTALRTTLLRASDRGADAKLLWSMPNDIEPTRTCYNLDVNAAYYLMYAGRKQKGTDAKADTLCCAITTSWAGLLYSCPTAGADSIRFGVSAVSLDERSQSPIVWEPYHAIADSWTEEATHDVVPETLPDDCGRQPEITDIAIYGDTLLTYTGIAANGSVHRGISLQERGYGVLANDSLVGLAAPQSFSIEAWVRPTIYWADTQLFSIRDKTDSWFANECGFCWHFVDTEGHASSLCFRTETGGTATVALPATLCVPAGRWSHLRYGFSYRASDEAWQVALWVNDTLRVRSAWMTGLYPWRPLNVISFGGHQYNHPGIDGVIDGFSLTVGDEKTVIPASAAHRLDYTSGEAEGVGTLSWLPDIYAPGCPWISSTDTASYDVITEALWQIPGAQIIDTDGDDTSGWAKVHFARPGTYQAKLILRNGYGQDERTYPLITVSPDDETATIETVLAERAEASERQCYDIYGHHVSRQRARGLVFTGKRSLYIKP